MCELPNHPHCLPRLLPRDVAPFCCMCFLHAYKNRIRLLPCRVASGTEMNLIYGAKKDLTLWPRLRPSHTPTHTHTYSLCPHSNVPHRLFCFVSFCLVLCCFVFRFGFVLFEQGRGDRGFKRHWKGSLFKKRTRAALLAIMAIMICVLSAAPAPPPTSTSLSL